MIPLPAAGAVLEFLGKNWLYLALGALVLAVGVQTKRVQWAKEDAAKVQSEFDRFKGGVAALGEKARADAAAREAADKQRKENADAENKHAHEALRREHARMAGERDRLRHERDAARRSLVPAAPAGSRCPDGQACFERAELERALQRHRERIRAGSDRAAGLAHEGSQIEADLATARRWAQGAQAPANTLAPASAP